MSRWDNYPMLAREVLDTNGGTVGAIRRLTEERPTALAQGFPFESWAIANRFYYPAWSLPFFRLCESAAEAFFLKPFTESEGARVHPDCGDRMINDAGLVVRVQVPVFRYRADFTIERGSVHLAAEVDGFDVHHRTSAKVSEDYLRRRRVMLAGYAVVPFTATEAISAAGECWRQIAHIVDAMEARG